MEEVINANWGEFRLSQRLEFGLDANGIPEYLGSWFRSSEK